MLESSQRIEQLAEIFRQKQQAMSDPGPPSALPMTIKNSNCISQSLVLFTYVHYTIINNNIDSILIYTYQFDLICNFRKAMFYTQPNTFIHWLSLIVLSVSLSLIVGAIFWDIPNSDPQLNLNDRLGYHYSIMCISIWPILLTLTISDIRRNKATIERDIKDNLYGRTTYIITKVF